MYAEAFPLTISGTKINFDMVPVAGGVFAMGDEHGDLRDACRPIHEVEVGDFSIGRFPVTQALWKAVMDGENPSHFAADDRPVESVSWYEVQEIFLPKLNEALPGFAFRLPTEAEWEYAARGGQAMRTSAYQPTEYAGSDKLKEVGWFDSNSHRETKPVGLKAPNPLGLHDMSGNVWEYCGDWFEGDYYKRCKKQGLVKNPNGPEVGGIPVLRGGSCSSFAHGCRVAFRSFDNPWLRDGYCGFRLAASF